MCQDLYHVHALAFKAEFMRKMIKNYFYWQLIENPPLILLGQNYILNKNIIFQRNWRVPSTRFGHHLMEELIVELLFLIKD